MRHAYMFLVGKLQRKGRFGDMIVDGRIILKWILNKQELKLRNPFN
jgi:hypothetical protein